MLSVSADFQKGILSTRSTSKRDIVNFLDTLQINKVTTKETAPDLFAVELEATKEALFHCFRHEGKVCILLLIASYINKINSMFPLVAFKLLLSLLPLFCFLKVALILLKI